MQMQIESTVFEYEYKFKSILISVCATFILKVIKCYLVYISPFKCHLSVCILAYTQSCILTLKMCNY